MPNLTYRTFLFVYRFICIALSSINTIFKNRSAVLKIALISIVLLFSMVLNMAFAVNVIPPTATVYACPTFPTAYFNLGTIKIKESGTSDFPSSTTNGTMILTAPPDFQFQVGVGSCVDLTTGAGNITGVSVTVTATTITITYSTGVGSAKTDSIAITGVQVRGINTFSGGTVVKTGGTPVVAGADGPTYANLSSIIFPQAFAGSDQLVCATTSTMEADPLLSNITGSWSVISGTGTFGTPGSPTSGISGLSVGINKFRWTTTAAGGCSNYAEVVITRETSGFACANQANQFSAVSLITTGTGTCTTAGTKTVFTLVTPAPFNPGDKVLIIQMQGATVNTTAVEPPTDATDLTFGTVTAYNGAGNYEFAVIDTKVGSDVTFVQNLVNTYNVAGKVQLVTVPQYANHSISTNLSGTAWNGTTGGVLTFEVAGTLTLNSTISMDGKGFLGGARSNLSGGCDNANGLYTRSTAASGTAFRGYGIADFGAEIYGRGAYANAGGGGSGHNSGGGGGGNLCAGGRGGYEYSSCYSGGSPWPSSRPVYSGTTFERRHGRPGYALAVSSTRIFMGGGGGGANGDDGNGSAGGAGGGIIIISAGEIAGTAGIISSNGIAGENNGTSQTPISFPDGAGAGGAGGSVLLNVGIYSIGSFTARANGGKGGDNGQLNVCHGTGGGGGGGLVWTSGASVTSNVTRTAFGGAAGVAGPQNANDACYNATFGAQPGGTCAAQNNLLLNTRVCCSVADLGPDQPLCGAGTLTLNNGTGGASTNKVFTWYKNGVLITGPGSSGPTYDATTSGLYTVRVDSIVGGYTFCTSQDNMVITSNMPVPILGTDQTICSPAFLNLSPQNLSTFPASTTWQWTKNGVAIAGATTAYLNNTTTSGTYRLTATAAGCASTFDEITLTTVVPIVIDGCNSSAGTVNLSVSGGLGGPYEWYANSSGGGILTTGTSYNPSVITTTTFWVQDKGLLNTTIGPSATSNSFTGMNGNGNTAPGMRLNFDVTTAFTLNGMSLFIYYNNCGCASGTQKVTLDVYNSANAIIGSVTANYVCCPSGPGITISGGAYTTFTFTTPLNIPVGNGYYIMPSATAGANTNVIGLYAGGGATAWPYVYSPLMSLKSNGDINSPTQFPSYMDWQISYNVGCTRVPVVATIGGSCSLPVNMIYFTADNKDNNILLSWATASESDNDYFLVQRSSDGVQFETIGKISGNGTSSSLIQYSFTDTQLPSGIIYYRLIQLDYDGQSAASNIIAINNGRTASISVSPNPFEEGTNVVLKSLFDYKVHVKITDLTGNTLYSSGDYHSNGMITIGQNLPSGMYILEVKSDYETRTFRIVKINQ